jgi:hypothetical protein
MAAADRSAAVKEQIRQIVTDGEDTRQGWGDEQIVAEAMRRVRGSARSADTSGPAIDATDDWSAIISEIRSETDNDGQTRR